MLQDLKNCSLYGLKWLLEISGEGPLKVEVEACGVMPGQPSRLAFLACAFNGGSQIFHY